MMLLSKRRVSAPQLAQHFEVSLRTIYRDLEAINAAGIPIVAYPGSQGGFEILENFTIDRQFLSLEEWTAVVAVLKGAHSSADDSQIGLLLDKIKALISTSQSTVRDHVHPVVYDFNPWGSTPAMARKVGQWREAIEQRKRVKMVYSTIQGDTQERTIEPVTLIVKGYVWYVYGFCLWRNEYRLFRLSRIEEQMVLPSTFPPHENTVDKLEWLDEWDDKQKVSLLLRFSPKVHVRVRDLFESAHIETLEDGSLLVRMSAAEDEWLYGMLLSFGDALCVLEPESVRRHIQETSKKMLASYEEC